MHRRKFQDKANRVLVAYLKKTVKDSVGLYYRPSVADKNLLADHCPAVGRTFRLPGMFMWYVCTYLLQPLYPDIQAYVHVVWM